ncbi:hypothetical protein COS31_05715 [Candidatus Roizmanbacteria bacterium CG02_land_8_20_14_3_00_36_15]|uniref:Xaa-Pro dipeptidase n=2 Tax=Candidatus Roizmaniibacteriota TaxID=1752723 RepID=A0A2M8KKG3_9BACT|nr:MAG: hypothetical protein COS51_00870 [Candidatus Roizmanbacteria bacterium CG03_land_8_20_14_0_80_36_21]PIV37234.1 MAG: hypothetical protein COS31_05715 [Candidatus Roizmanbacteria bacterium CG02_land_8_20_14_3_00_36_15]PJC82014.1 MAG: hypothetical protein CO007_01570 [Candidatus Roizmanbacteria bacterium CG_4_8_14_3_um_filter_36_10]PJE60416.1 MAG: hypothetical protein COU86_04485 [Candidatus Roizmanbacteria bacterium CG10_big_fil_rev_8_21_14_0_10_36_26]
MLDQIDKLQNQFKEKNLDGLLISNYYNILYLTGFKTLTKDEREAWVLVTINNTYIFSDGRYFQKYQISNIKYQKFRPKVDRPLGEKIKYKLISSEKGLIAYLREIITEEKLRMIGFEGEDLRVNELRRLEQTVPAIKFIPTDKLLLIQREIKDREEIEKIKKACQIGDQCLKEIIPTIRFNQTEKEIAFRIEFWLKEKGLNIAFPPLVAIDQNSAIPHYDTESNGQEKVKKNSLILIDFGVDFQNYLSDMTRVVFFGKPRTEQINVYQKLSKAQRLTMKQCRNINSLKKIDEYCRSRIVNHGLPSYPHSTGHGVGLEIHEYPKISQTSTDVLKPNQVFTIEPGIYFPGKWGMRIEDIIYNKDSQPVVLTKFPKDLII